MRALNHITLAVANLDRSFRFYVDILDLVPLVKWSKGAYLLAGSLWFCLSEDSNTRDAALPEYTHFAFSCKNEEFAGLSERIVKAGAKIWKTNQSEGESLYFEDPDGHKLELHVGDWRSRLSDIKRDPWEEGMQFFPLEVRP